MDDNSLYSRYFDIAQLPSLLCTGDAHIIRANAAMAHLLGVPAATLPGRALANYLTLADPELIGTIATQNAAGSNTIATLVTAATHNSLHLQLEYLPGDEDGVVLLTVSPAAPAHGRAHPAQDEETLSLILDAVHDGVWDWDAHTGQVYRSPGWLRMFGYDSHAKDVAAWTGLIHPDDLERVLANFNAHLEQRGDIYESEYRMRTADGQWKWTQDRGRVVERDSQGNVVRMIGAHLDIDKRKRAELDLKTYRDNLEQQVYERTAELVRVKENAVRANRSKSDFLASISHEIRTPLNAVLGMVALLKRLGPTPEQLEYINIIDSSGEMLLTLIDDVLDLSKVEAGLLILVENECELNHEVTSVVALMRSVAEKKGLPLELTFGGILPSQVTCDAHRLRQILFNLIGNAIKFTHTGGIKVDVTGTRAANGKYRITITVADTGIGISTEMQQRIFDPFSQADSSISRNYGGSGLGLSISARLIELMGGTISVSSSPDQGSTFTIEVVLAGSSAVTSHKTQTPPVNNPKPRPLTILTVDDDSTNRLVVSRLLGDCGHNVTTASSASDAIAAIQQQAFDLILMDLHMPGVNGLQATREIRSLGDGRFRDIPIIALSANALIDTIEECFHAGMNGHLSKPIRTEELFSLLNELQE